MFSGDITYLQLAYIRVDENFRRNPNFVNRRRNITCQERLIKGIVTRESGVPASRYAAPTISGVEKEGDDIILLSTVSASRYRPSGVLVSFDSALGEH